MQQSATVGLHKCAFPGHFLQFWQSVIIAFVHAGKVLIWCVIAQVQKRIRKPLVAGSIPAIGSIPYSESGRAYVVQRRIIWLVRFDLPFMDMTDFFLHPFSTLSEEMRVLDFCF